MKSSMFLISVGIVTLLLSWSTPVLASEAGTLTLDAEGGKQVEFSSYQWGDGSTGTPGADAVSGGKIHSITLRRKPDDTSSFLASAKNKETTIPSASLQLPGSGGAAGTTVTMYDVTVVNILPGGGTTDVAAASEMVKLGFARLEVASGN